MQEKDTGLSTLYLIALDYPPIQASAVPCERVFSSTAKTDTKRHNRIHPVLMEALQMVKFSLKNDRLNFTEGLITPKCDMVDDMPEVDLLQVLLEKDSVAGMDAVIAALGQDDEDT
ncbi:hypothetical protein K443DRAFT_103726 [Laccaria amethystina LaAM-08-1]|uniref:HAT C-terminal dimerisation domain-containing protein n=1 Tax=Laccaria amethystina LaAM-08-1 TaxID=1095629 RepID=A0A0C9XAS5_9AGAR|nr:hypothetical protein K443DRAFT_103726 [Laccaria amethystina LaAM-08-1]